MDAQLKRPLDEHDHIQGAPTAPVTVVLYGDYESEASASLQSLMEAVQLHFGSQVHFAYRHLPDPQHPHAFEAAEAAEAAAAQGRFWEMHTLLFEQQEDLTPETLLGCAQELRLDLEKYREAMQTHTFRGHVQQDVDSARQAGVPSAPALFVNERLYAGVRTLRALVEYLEAEARRAPRTFAGKDQHPFL